MKSPSVEKTIIHEITKPDRVQGKKPELVLSNALSPLDDDSRRYFRQRITESLELAAFPVLADPNRTSPTPDLVHELFTGPNVDFVEMSKAMAKHLFAAQQGVSSSPGLLVLCAGQVEGGDCLTVLKLQKHEGVNLERTGQSGAETYSVEHLHRLMLTNDTRVYKIALFESNGVLQADDIYALVSDKQRFSSPEKRVADFFLHDFLGCRLREDPTQVTNTYFVSIESHLNKKIIDPEKRARYHRAFIADLASQSGTVMPKRFAETHLEESDRNGFLDALKAEAIPITQFAKDTELIQARLREEEYVFGNGIKVRGSQEALKNGAEISRGDGDVLEMLITGHLETIKGTTKRK